LYVKEIVIHKMWDVAQIIMLGVNRDICSYYAKSTHPLVCSSAKKASLTGIQADFSSLPLFHDALLLVPFKNPAV